MATYPDPSAPRPHLSDLVEWHSVLRGDGDGPRRERLLTQLNRYLEPQEEVIAYADRYLPHGETRALDALVATDRQLMRFVQLDGPGSAGSVISGSYHRLHVPRRFLHHVGLEIFLSPEETVGRWDLAPAVPHVNVRLPAALRLNPEAQWWSWEPPERRERNAYGRGLLQRAPMWREAFLLYRAAAGR